MSGTLGDGFQVRRLETTAEAERVLGEVGQLAHVGFWTLEPVSLSLTWSDAMYVLYGFDPDAPPASVHALTARYHPEDRNRFGKLIMAAFASGEGFDAHHRVVWPSGEVRFLWTRARCGEPSGGRRRLYGVTQDLTDIRGGVAELQTSAGAYRFIADNTRDLITRRSVDGRLTYVSPSCKAITGYSPEEMMGLRAPAVIHPDDVDDVVGVLQGLYGERTAGDTARLEYRLRHKDGHWIWLEANARVVTDASGRILESVDAVRDITQRKLDEAALADARAAADAAATAKSEFLANMSHELRTPLTSILGFAGLIGAGGGLSETDDRYVKLVREAGRVLLDVVNDILDFSRLEAGAMTLRPEPFRLGALVRDTAEIVRHLAEAKGLRLEVEAADDTGLLGDPARLRQILLNLVGNAVKFTDAGEVRVTASVWPGEGGAAALRLAVSDTGIGVPADQLGRLFDRFSQVDGSDSRLHGGTGLGLAIAQRLSALMGGRMGVDSVVGAGSTFWLEALLPMATLVDAPVAAAADGPARALRVLVAEDHRVNQALARMLLEALGCVVDVASDGVEAVAAVRAAHYDLVFMDMQMPVMDGLHAARAIKALGGRFARLPIVAMTANVLPEQVARCREAGMCDHVAKPIDVSALAAVLARHGSARPQADADADADAAARAA